MARYAAATAPATHEPLVRAPAHRTRRRRHAERRIPWPGDVTPDSIILPSLEDIPDWINGPRSRARKMVGLALGATLAMDVAYLLMHLAG